MRATRPDRSERGAALVIALTTMALTLALGCALVLLASSETGIAANFRSGHESLYAADAAIEWALADLQNVPDWTPVVAGTARSSFADGPPSGTRTLRDGSQIKLDEIVNLANCQHVTACSDAEMATVTGDRPWGANNPRWTAYAYGPLDGLRGATVHSPFYIVALAGDDPSENDGDPAQDGAEVDGRPNPGRGVMMLRAEAFGPRNAHRVVEATVARIDIPPTDPDGQVSTQLRVLSWREVH